MKETNQGITAAILAGGLGTRLRSVVPDKPKVIAEVHGRPFVTYLLDQLAEAGLRSVVLCTGYMADQVENCLGETYRSLTLRYSREEEPLGTGGAIRLALPMLERRPTLLVNGDSYCAVDLDRLWHFHQERKSKATMVLSRMDDARRFGLVETDERYAVTRFLEKGQAEGSGWVNAGIYLLEREFVESIPAGIPVSLEREIIPNWIGQGLFGLHTEGKLWDIGVPDTYIRANVEFETSQADDA